MTAVIVLCGGPGTRMGAVSQDQQKCLSRLWGLPLLHLVLARLCPAVAGADVPIVLLTGHHGHQVADLVGQWRTQLDPRIQVVAEHGPGWVGVEHAARDLRGPVLIVAGNVLLDYETLIPQMLDEHQRGGRPVVAASEQWRTTGHYTLTAAHDTVTSWHRAADTNGATRPGRYEVVDTYLLTDPVLALMRARQISHTRALSSFVAGAALGFCAVPGDWLHVETPADLIVASNRKASLCPALPPSSSCPVRPPSARAPSPADSRRG
ncbi:NDP-sugar synthase [Amycolatopsis sp. NPDC058278]|uniref:nucleotidyltransferase family protein n=1 Tax=Amycolatopsis sp. NPDC058278 TaxID=3346417 RepID=UPI0036DC2C02